MNEMSSFFTFTFKTSSCIVRPVSQSKWMEHMDRLSDQDKEVLVGTSLSKLFTTWPIWLNHPANISALYGALISLSLLLPYAFGDVNQDVWFEQWIVHASLLVTACAVAGFLSAIIIHFSKRFPVSPPRSLLYPMPFVGLAMITIDRADLISFEILIPLIWLFLLFPGPMYVHLSWAPRHRLLCLLDDGKNPFEHMTQELEDDEDKIELTPKEHELIEVVDAFDAEE